MADPSESEGARMLTRILLTMENISGQYFSAMAAVHQVLPSVSPFQRQSTFFFRIFKLEAMCLTNKF